MKFRTLSWSRVFRVAAACAAVSTVIIWGGALSSGAQPAELVQPATGAPFLWRIEGPVPSYLFGTIHVPDARVLALPEVVRKALDASDSVYTEIPLDVSTQASMASSIMLPEGQDLRKLAGDELFGRLVKLVGKAFGSGLPAGAADLLGQGFARLKPWAASSQLELLAYLPDLMSGQQPLDVEIYQLAVRAGKKVGGIETLQEQLGVFDGFTMDEQLRMMASALKDLEEPQPGAPNSVKQLVDLYLAGDLSPLADELARPSDTDPLLQKKFIQRVVEDRNTKMGERIAAHCEEKPARSSFFAVGVLHYANETGILSQLARKGYKVTRLVPGDAASIVRKPAA